MVLRFLPTALGGGFSSFAPPACGKSRGVAHECSFILSKVLGTELPKQDYLSCGNMHGKDVELMWGSSTLSVCRRNSWRD